MDDTRAIVARPLESGIERTTRVRKIDNGYLTCKSEYNPDTGAYRSSEEFSRTPNGPSVGAGGSVGKETLSDTKTYLGKDV